MKNTAFVLMVLTLVVLPLAAADPEAGKTFETNGVTIWYEVRGVGTGTPLLIVNGGPGFDHAYTHLGDPVWERFEKSRRVIFYDQRGNGRSSELKPGQSCTLADQIADLEALRAQLGDQKVDLLGHSWGGYLVMAYAAHHPEHLRRLVIVDSAAPKWSDTKFLFNDIFPETTAKQDALNFADTLGDKKASSDSLALYLSMLFYSAEKRDAAMPRLLKSDFHKTVNEAVSADVDRFDLNPELPKFAFPTLVITGRFDINVAPSVAWKIHKAIPGSQFAVFEQSGHIPYFEEPEAFARVLGAFLQ
jgi:proline iminopeptidase